MKSASNYRFSTSRNFQCASVSLFRGVCMFSVSFIKYNVAVKTNPFGRVKRVKQTAFKSNNNTSGNFEEKKNDWDISCFTSCDGAS